jgi:hypothetical protein
MAGVDDEEKDGNTKFILLSSEYVTKGGKALFLCG